MIKNPHRPLLIIISAPSGAGKTTLCERLLSEEHNICYSVSTTTRPPRKGEVNEQHYHFVDQETFDAKRKSNSFLECALVHDHWYGTSCETVLSAMNKGRDVLLDIDVQGARHIRNHLLSLSPRDSLRRGFVDVFITPPSIDVLRERIVKRGKDTSVVIEQRMQNAGNEMLHWNQYRYLVVNDDLEASYIMLKSILVAERLRVFA